jgi:hypothetical protein
MSITIQQPTDTKTSLVTPQSMASPVPTPRPRISQQKRAFSTFPGRPVFSFVGFGLSESEKRRPGDAGYLTMADEGGATS